VPSVRAVPTTQSQARQLATPISEDAAHTPPAGMIRATRRVGLVLAAGVSVGAASILIYRSVPRAFEGMHTAELVIALGLLVLPPCALAAMRIDARQRADGRDE